MINSPLTVEIYASIIASEWILQFVNNILTTGLKLGEIFYSLIDVEVGIKIYLLKPEKEIEFRKETICEEYEKVEFEVIK